MQHTTCTHECMHPFGRAKALGKHGGKRVKGQVDIINLKTQGGTSAEYLTAKLEKEGHHELAEKVRTAKGRQCLMLGIP